MTTTISLVILLIFSTLACGMPLLPIKRTDVAKKLADPCNKLLLFQPRVPHLIDSPAEIVEQLGLVQEFRSAGGVVLADNGGEHLRAANPSADAHKLGKICVAELHHGAADILQARRQVPRALPASSSRRPCR